MVEFFKKNKKSIKNKISKNKGVTLIELLVVISIFTIITGISIFNYNNFNSYTSIQNLADDIALTIREAQSYAIGVRASDNIFDTGFGVHFSINSNPDSPYSGSNDSFILFSDIDDNNIYDYNETDGMCGEPEDGNECLEILTVQGDQAITGIYVDGSEYSIDSEESMDIVFKRPYPEPEFCYHADGTGCASGISYIEIKVSDPKDPDNIYRIIRVSNVGQISIYAN